MSRTIFNVFYYKQTVIYVVIYLFYDSNLFRENRHQFEETCGRDGATRFQSAAACASRL